MAIAFRSANTTTYASRTNTTVTAPAGIQDDDILLLFGFTLSASAGVPAVTMTPPGGFAQVTLDSGAHPAVNTNSAGENIKAWVWWKRAASEAGNYTMTHTVSFSQSGIMALSGGILSGTPTDGASSAVSTNVATTTSTSITTTVADTLLVWMSHDWGNTTNNLSAPTGMTERYEVNPLIYGATEARAAIGATGTRSHTNNSGTGVNNMQAVFMVAIKPEPPQVGFPIWLVTA